MKIAYLVYWYTFICLSSVFLQFFWSRKSLSLLVSLLFCKESIFIPTFAWTLTGSCKKGIGSLLLNKSQVTCITKKVTVHGFKGSEVQRLHSHHHTSFCKRFARENRPLPHPHKSGTWYLAIMWQNQRFLRGFRVFNFVIVPNPEC